MIKISDIIDQIKNNINSTTPDYYLFMLGTETVFTLEPTQKTYENGETLSYIARVVADRLNEKPTINNDQQISYTSDSIAVINGPTTLGSEVGDRVANGVLQCLMAIASGKKTIEIMAHSRGSVESILITHELERIKHALKVSPKKSFKQILLDTPCSYTKAAFNTLTDVLDADNELDELSGRLETTPINLFLMDPVPGDTIAELPLIAWKDPRFYQKLPCNSAELLLFRDERTRCFIPIVPNGLIPLILPGHHGTASGNLYSQQLESLPQNIEQQDTSTVQKLVIAKLLYFIDCKTNLLKNNKTSVNLNHEILDKITNQYVEDESDKQKFIIALYDEVLKNDKAFKYFADNTSYKVLGRLCSTSGARFVHYGAHNYIGLDTITPELDGQFVNTEHAVFFLHQSLDFKFDFANYNPVELVAQMTNSLQELLSNYKLNDSKAKALLDKKENRTLPLNAISVFVNAISQKVLRNHLTIAEKTKLMDQIRVLFRMLNEQKNNNPQNEALTAIVDEMLTVLKTGILNTTVSYYNSLLDQSTFIHQRVKYYSLPDDKDFKLISDQDLLIELQRLYETAVSLIDGKLGLQELIDGNLEVINVEMLQQHMEQLVKHAANILINNNVNLGKKPETMSQEFFAKVKPIAIAYGAVNPELTNAQTVITQQQQQIEELVALNKKLSSADEIKCATLINDKLIPLTEDYLKHLRTEAEKINPMIDKCQKEELPLIDLTDPIYNDYHKILVKFNIMKLVLKKLEDAKTHPLPSARILEFAKELQGLRNNQEFTAHRDPVWQRYAKLCFIAIAVICTGIIPGLAAIIGYSMYTGKSPLFFTQSMADQYIDQSQSTLTP